MEHVCRGPLHRRKIWRQTTSSARTVMRKFGGNRHPHKHKSRQQWVIFLGQQARRKRNTSQLIWTIRAIQAQQTTGSSTYHIPPPRRNSTKDDLAQTTEHNNLLRQQQLNSTSSTPPSTIPTRAHTTCTYCSTSIIYHETTYLGRRTRPAPVGERRHGHAQRRHIYRYQPPAPTAAPEPPAASMARAAGLGYSLRQRDRRYGTSSRRRRIMQYWDKSVRLR